MNNLPSLLNDLISWKRLVGECKGSSLLLKRVNPCDSSLHIALISSALFSEAGEASGIGATRRIKREHWEFFFEYFRVCFPLICKILTS